MYPTRIACRPQTGHRVARQAAPACSRGMSSGFFPAPFFGAGRHGPNPFAGGNSGLGDIAPIIRIVDDATRAFENFPFGAPSRRQAQRAQQEFREPRFDVREVDDAYELRGELPGVESKNLDVEFTDANTLVIRGRTESEHTSGANPDAVQAATEPAATPADNTDASDTASVHSNDSTSSYVKPTVEDEATAESTTTTTNTEKAPATDNAPEQQQQQPEQATPHFWLNERSTGTFQRTFSFAARVDHDGVTASLRNGILNVSVPKAPEPAARKISVQ